MAVSITSTVNHVFAGLVLDPVTGIILNNEVSAMFFKTFSLMPFRWMILAVLADQASLAYGHRLVSFSWHTFPPTYASQTTTQNLARDPSLPLLLRLWNILMVLCTCPLEDQVVCVSSEQ